VHMHARGDYFEGDNDEIGIQSFTEISVQALYSLPIQNVPPKSVTSYSSYCNMQKIFYCLMYTPFNTVYILFETFFYMLK
jgi:hypothetical protein